jgi:hypothetical protein
MFVAAGSWSLIGGAYSNSTNTSDNVSLFDLNTWLPSYYEVTTSAKGVSGGGQFDAFIIFDYQSADNFKYAGVDAAHNLLKIGQHTATGWTDAATLTVKGLTGNGNNSFKLAANFTTATVTFGTYTLSYNFTAPLNTGMLGVGANNSLTSFTSYTVQKLPVAFTYTVLEDLSDGVANNFTAQTGTWTATSGTTGRYSATPAANGTALSTRPLAVATLSYVEYSATVNAGKAGAYAGLVFDFTSVNDFLYAAVIAGTNQVVLGHVSKGAWYVDAVASATIAAGTDYSLLVALTEGVTNGVNVVLNGKSVLSFNYNYPVHDGSLGLFARNGNASFDNVLIRGDDIAYASGGTPQAAADAPAQPVDAAPLTADQLATIVAAATRLWTDALGAGDPRLAILDQVTVLVGDLSDGLLGATTGTTIVIDGNAAGWGWFADATPLGNSEFAIALGNGVFAANPASPAYGHMDLLSTVLHELGNAMGFAEDAGQDVTGATLPAGVRRLPTAAGAPATVAALAAADVPSSAAAVATSAVANTAAMAAADVPSSASVPAAVATSAVVNTAAVVAADVPPSASVPAQAARSEVADAAAGWPAVSGVAPGLVVAVAAPPAGPVAIPYPNLAAGPTATTVRGAARDSNLGGSFVTLDPLTATGPTLPPAGEETPSAGHQGSSAKPTGVDNSGGSAVIAWDSDGNSVLNGDSALSGGSQDWLDDFLNHRGQNETLWNPNAGIRVRPSATVTAA